MPRKRTPEEEAAYKREYRARKKAAIELGPPPVRETPGNVPDVETLACGCQPGNLCISHAGAAMSQQQRDVILDRMLGKDTPDLRSVPRPTAAAHARADPTSKAVPKPSQTKR